MCGGANVSVCCGDGGHARVSKRRWEQGVQDSFLKSTRKRATAQHVALIVFISLSSSHVTYMYCSLSRTLTLTHSLTHPFTHSHPLIDAGVVALPLIRRRRESALAARRATGARSQTGAADSGAICVCTYALYATESTKRIDDDDL
jgi:hypothetical protein